MPVSDTEFFENSEAGITSMTKQDRPVVRLKKILSAAGRLLAADQEHFELVKEELRAVPVVVFQTAEDLREKDLQECVSALDEAELAHRSAPTGVTGFFKGLVLKRRVSSANRALTSRKAEVDTKVERVSRANRAAEIRAEYDRRADLVRAVEKRAGELSTREAEVAQLRDTCVSLVDAITRSAWIGSNLEASIGKAETALGAGTVGGAGSALEAVRYQKKPSQEFFEHCEQVVGKLAANIRRESFGFNAIAPFPGIIEPSFDLYQRLSDRKSLRDWLARQPVRSDQWTALLPTLIATDSVKHMVNWILFWTFLEECQGLAGSLCKQQGGEQGIATEDALTGRLCGELNIQLRGRAAQWIKDLGYPDTHVSMRLVQTAGLDAEAATGADLGLVIRIGVGDLNVSKVALVQAKKSTAGIANVGSNRSGPTKQTQLQKLCDLERDFYLFYHLDGALSLPMLPTVTRASDIRANVGSSVADEKLNYQCRNLGWDFPSFVAFGLCAPDSGVGKVVPQGVEPLDVLTSGGSSSLPRMVLVITVADNDREPHPEQVLVALRECSYEEVELGSLNMEKRYDGPSLDYGRG